MRPRSARSSGPLSPPRSASHDGVLALGGGAVLDPATRELLAGQTVVFLRVGLSRRGEAGRSRLRSAAAARQRPGPDQVAARRAHPDLRVRGRPFPSRPTAGPRRGRRRGPARPDQECRAVSESVLHVGGAAPYDVVVGHDLAGAAAGPDRRRRRNGSRVIHSDGARRAGPRRPRRARRRVRRAGPPDPRRRAGQVRRGRGRAAGRRSERPASPGPTRWSRSAAARRPTSAASSRRPGCAASGSCTCRPRSWPWSMRQWAARPA